MESIGSDAKLLFRLLEATSLRSEVLAANLANQNTPGYVRRTVEFEDALRAALGEGAGEPDGVRPSIVEDRRSPARPDGNNVSAELELNALRENRLVHELYLAMLGGHFRMIDHAIQ